MADNLPYTKKTNRKAQNMKLIKNWLLRKQIKQAVKLLQKIDGTMKSLDMPRWKRKQIWRDFIKSGKQRMNVIKILNGAKP